MLQEEIPQCRHQESCRDSSSKQFDRACLSPKRQNPMRCGGLLEVGILGDNLGPVHSGG